MDKDFRKQVGVNVVAGLIIALILAIAGLAYSLLNDLSFYEFVGFVIVPASGIGFLASLGFVLHGQSKIIENILAMLAQTTETLRDLTDELQTANKRIQETENRLGRQIAQAICADVIAEAKSNGWTLAPGNGNRLDFSHPTRGITSVDTREIDPEELRLLLRLGPR